MQRIFVVALVMLTLIQLVEVDNTTRTLIVISPHQDDEWLAYAQMIKEFSQDTERRGNWRIHVVYVTKSLWPGLPDYDVRVQETKNACNYLGVVAHYLQLTEEELYDPPYDPGDYIGNTMEAEWAPILLTKLLSIADDGPIWVAYPSADDGAAHPVHGFTRNIYLAIQAAFDAEVDLQKEMEYYVRITDHVPDVIRFKCNFSWKMGYFIYFYPTQWTEIEKDPLSKEQVEWCCKWEYDVNETV
jgi:LmbE family N-acetylglucosaminyl deacetylase